MGEPIQYLPEACHGGLKQKDVFTGIALLDHAHTHLKLPLVSLDFSIRAMNSAGLPTSLADMLRHVWCDQYRSLQYGSSTSISPAGTGSSLLQGDCAQWPAKCNINLELQFQTNNISG